MTTQTAVAPGFGAASDQAAPPPNNNPPPVPEQNVQQQPPAEHVPVAGAGAGTFQAPDVTAVPTPMFLTSFKDRAAEKRHSNILLEAEVGFGKTYQVNFFPPETLFVNMEAGEDSIKKGWGGMSLDVRSLAQHMRVHPWQLCQAIALLIAGPEPAVKPDNPYSESAYMYWASTLAPYGITPAFLAGMEYIYWDSLSVASRHAYEFYQGQPEFIADSGNINTMGVYGEVGIQLSKWYSVIQHSKKTTIVTCILERDTNNLGQIEWSLQIVGKQGKVSLPGIFDHVIALVNIPDAQGVDHQGLLCKSPNRLAIPGLKSRSADSPLGELEMYGAPNIYELVQRLA